MTQFGLAALIAILQINASHSFLPGFAPNRLGSNSGCASRWTTSTKSINTCVTGSTRSSGSTTQTRASDGDDEEILDPPGTHYTSENWTPVLQELSTWAATPGKYYSDLSDQYDGAPVYKCHPGLASIALTDHASGEWFFNQPDTVLDRQDEVYFGPFQCRPEYVGDCMPCLAANNEEAHRNLRAYTLAIMSERLGSIQTAWEHSSDTFFDNLWTNGMGDRTTLYEVFLQQTMAFMLEWWFGTGEEGGQELPPFDDFYNVNPSNLLAMVFQLTADIPEANAYLESTRTEVTDEEKASVEVLLNSIKDSKMYETYVNLMEEQGVVIDDLANALMFNTGFQSSTAMAGQMHSAVCSLTAFPDFLSDLRAELDGKELTYDTVDSAENFPLLDSLHWEILRYCPAPAFFFKAAKEDLVVPTSSGSKYQIREGDMLLAHHPLIHIDEAVFGSTATEFNPRRFVDNADLKKKVFAYAFPDPSNTDASTDMPWGCAVHTMGLLDSTIKLFYGRWVQEAAWELAETPVIDPETYLGSIGPASNTFTTLTSRN